MRTRVKGHEMQDEDFSIDAASIGNKVDTVKLH